MADQIDRAQQNQADQIQESLTRREVKRPLGPSLEICLGCGGEIPEERRQAIPGCTRCIECQSEVER